MKYMKIKVQEKLRLEVLHYLGRSDRITRVLLGDRVMWLGRMQSARLSRSGGCFGCEDIFLKEVLGNKRSQIPSEAPEIDDLVPHTVVVGAVPFSFGK